MHRRQSAVVWMLFALGTTFAGCGKGSGVARVPIHGTISVSDGEKLNGFITFLPDEGRGGPAATTKLADGEYQFDRHDGPTIGPHRVIIKRIIPKSVMMASRNDSRLAHAKGASAKEPKEWTLSFDVTDDGKYVCDFAIDP